MKLRIQARGLPRAAELRQYAATRLRTALMAFAGAIDAVSVRLGDINGPDRGGVDKLCRVVIDLKNHSSLVVEELGSDIAQAIDRAAGRLARLLAQRPRPV